MDKEIFVDENGMVFDPLEQRNDEIKSNLEEILQMFLKEANASKMSFKKFGFRMQMQIEDELGKYGIMSADEFVNLDYDKIENHWRHFHSLFAYYNRYFEIVPNRQSFLLFMRINSRMYKQLQNHSNDDIRGLMIFIEDRLIGTGFSAGESGNANDKAIKTRLGAKSVGHEVVSAGEELAVQAVTGKSPQELEKEMKAILGTEIKYIK